MVAALLTALLLAGGQLQQGTIRGIVRGPDGSPAAGAVVTLVDGLGDPLQAVSADDAGRFQLTNVAPGTYALRAVSPALRASVSGVTVSGALPIDLDVRMSAVAEDQVLVRADQALEPGATTTRVTLAGESVRRAPSRLRSRGLQDAIATIPGWSTEDNGLLHARGVDDGFLYVVDGMPVYERIDGLFGVSPDPSMIDAITVSTGYIAPEFGFKSGGVIEVRSASRTTDAWVASLEGAVGNDAHRSVSGVAGGPLGPSTWLTAGLSSLASSRFLDPVHPDNLHNDGGTTNGGLEFGWALPSGSVTLVSAFGASNFDVPHGEDQEEAGQDQRQRIRQASLTASWQRAWASRTVSQAGGYYRRGSSALLGSLLDEPLFTDADRSLWRAGVLASVTREAGNHLLKVGGEAARLGLRERFLFAVTDPEEAEEAELSDGAIAHTLDDPFLFEGSAAPTLFSLYVQDSFRPHARVTIDAGVRADWSRLLVAASQVSPRVGLSYRWTPTTTVRGSVGRFFQPPQAENLLLSSSEGARALSPFVDDEIGGGAALPPERQTAFEAGLEHIVGRGARVDVAVWHRRITDAADPNVFFGSTIIFPNSIASGRASGVDIRLEVPRKAGWSGYVSYANSRVEQTGPVTGGLFLEEEVIEIGPGTRFTPDHDQRHVAATGLTWDHDRRGVWGSLTMRYESGTPLEVDEDDLEELAERPGAEMIDVARGRVKPRTIVDAMAAWRLAAGRRAELSLRVSLLNLTGARWAYNFGNPFSGTHFGPGRTLQAGIRVSVR